MVVPVISSGVISPPYKAIRVNLINIRCTTLIFFGGVVHSFSLYRAHIGAVFHSIFHCEKHYIILKAIANV